MKVKSVDTCDGNFRGALEVPLLLNEKLEAELSALCDSF
jgi:hypothetical protein